MRVLGIDPGSNYLGLGCVEARGSSFLWIGHRVIRVVPANKNLPVKDWPGRLKCIFESVILAIEEWAPQTVAVEEVFLAHNAQSALKLGQARGAAMTAAAMRDLPIAEYPARSIKQSVTGSGRAEKGQVQLMVEAILGGKKANLEFTRSDASDALAIAICHLQHRGLSRFLHSQPEGKSAEKAVNRRLLEGKTIR